MKQIAQTLILVAIGATLAIPAASAQPNPEFKYEEKPKEAVKDVEWKAEAQAGFILTTGNSQTTTLSGGGKASRKEGFNKFELGADLAFARSTIFVFQDTNGNGVIDGSGSDISDSNEVSAETQTTAQSWLVNARYDRFLTETDSLFVLAQVGADVPAGKDLIFGGQLGYSRQLFKDDVHELKGEAGYDFTFEDLASGETSSIHSLRVFTGYAGKLSDDTSVSADLEGLFNLNTVNNGRIDGDMEAGAFKDTRVNGNLGLTTKLFTDISFRFGFGFKYDNYAAPRPAPSGAAFADGFVPVSDELDTKTEASLIVNFL